MNVDKFYVPKWLPLKTMEKINDRSILSIEHIVPYNINSIDDIHDFYKKIELFYSDINVKNITITKFIKNLICTDLDIINKLNMLNKKINIFLDIVKFIIDKKKWRMDNNNSIESNISSIELCSKLDTEYIELMNIDLKCFMNIPKSIPLKSISMSSILSMATPTFPTSPSANSWSLSYPICVGKSKATLRPITPCDNK